MTRCGRGISAAAINLYRSIAVATAVRHVSSGYAWLGHASRVPARLEQISLGHALSGHGPLDHVLLCHTCWNMRWARLRWVSSVLSYEALVSA